MSEGKQISAASNPFRFNTFSFAQYKVIAFVVQFPWLHCSACTFMHDCHPQLSPYTLTGAPSQYNQSCKMLICFLTCTSLLIPRVIFNLQSFIATRQRGRRASIKYQREGVDLPPSPARKDAKERVGATMKSPCLYTRLCTYLHIPSYYDLPMFLCCWFLLARWFHCFPGWLE